MPDVNLPPFLLKRTEIILIGCREMSTFVPTNHNQANLRSKVVSLSSLIAVAVDAHQATAIAQDVNI
jgi:hypothetical protein